MTVIPVVPAHPGLPIAGSAERFPIRRAYCVGRNYGDHAREMGANPDREPPFFFSKPTDAVYAVDEGLPLDDVAPGHVPYPPQTSNSAPRGRAHRGHRCRREGHLRGHRTRARLGLRGRVRSDPTRRAGCGEADAPALGHGKGLRRLRPELRDRARPRRSATRTPDGSTSRSTASCASKAISPIRSGASPRSSPRCHRPSR